MTQLVVENLTFNYANGQIGNRVLKDTKFGGFRYSRTWINDFSYCFDFGKKYMLFGSEYHASAAISWIIAGILAQDSGTIMLNNAILLQDDLRNLSWYVIRDAIKQFGFVNKSVAWQVEQGLQKNPQLNYKVAQTIP